MSVTVEGLSELESYFDKVSDKMVKGKGELNMRRAKQFRKSTILNAVLDNLGLLPISQATEVIHNKKHPREVNKGELVRMIKNKSMPDLSVESGYFKDSGKIGKLPAEVIARLQHTGYKVPLFGAKGERVRKFLMVHKIFPKKETKWLVIPPSPFLFNSADRFENTGDKKIIKDWLNSVFSI